MYLYIKLYRVKATHHVQEVLVVGGDEKEHIDDQGGKWAPFLVGGNWAPIA